MPFTYCITTSQNLFAYLITFLYPFSSSQAFTTFFCQVAAIQSNLDTLLANSINSTMHNASSNARSQSKYEASNTISHNKYEASYSRSQSMNMTFQSKSHNKNRTSYPTSHSMDQTSHTILYNKYEALHCMEYKDYFLPIFISSHAFFRKHHYHLQ